MKLCKCCHKYQPIESGYCDECLELLVSKSEAMRLFGLSLSQIEVLLSQDHIKAYPFKSQKRYSRREIHHAIYETLGMEKKWSPTRTRCLTCHRIDKPHYASGYCLDCYKYTLEYETLKKYIDGYSFADIGREKGVSRERIRQLFEKAISNEAENVFGENYTKDDIKLIREETKKENDLNRARRLYAAKLLEKEGLASKLLSKSKSSSAKALVVRLGLSPKAALILKEVLPEIAETLKKNSTKWASEYECCIECGTTESHHRGRGLCEDCYAKSDYHKAAQMKWRNENYEHYREKQLEYEKEYYQRPEVKARVRKQSHAKRYGSNDVREQAIAKHNDKCRDCGLERTEHISRYGQDLSVLHIDGNVTNNELKNLVALCKNCSARAARQARLNQ